jgi:hypothetical protein
MSRTEQVLAQIDSTIADAEVSADAARWSPPPTDAERMRLAARGLRDALGLAARRLLR